jgi:predicted unusual protein kinase regulating ubiquinone biosynthesis (AarF/ABC1/UbiB family)
MWSQISLDLRVLTELLRLLRWVGRIKQDITLWADTLGEGLAQELDYEQVSRGDATVQYSTAQ